jgi:hypothetical protein
MEQFATGEDNPDLNAVANASTTWKSLQAAGAVDGWVEGLTDSSTTCDRVFYMAGPGVGHPFVALSLVIRFRDEASAAAAWRPERLSAYGLFHAPAHGRKRPAGLPATFESWYQGGIYIADWQEKAFGILLRTTNVPDRDADAAAAKMNQRAG